MVSMTRTIQVICKFCGKLVEGELNMMNDEITCMECKKVLNDK